MTDQSDGVEVRIESISISYPDPNSQITPPPQPSAKIKLAIAVNGHVLNDFDFEVTPFASLDAAADEAKRRLHALAGAVQRQTNP